MKQLNLYYLGGGGTNPDIPDGKTVTPINDVEIWQQCAGLDPVYNNLGAVLADSGYVAALMSDDNAVDYMVRSTEWATSHALVPIMTSNTTPSGECFAAQSLKSGYPAYYAFDNNTNTDARSSSDLSAHDVAYDFITPVNISKMVYNVAYYVTIRYQYSDDKILWEDGSSTISLSSVSEQQGTVIGNTLGAHRYWRFYGTQSSAGVGSIREIQFYSTAIPLVETAMQYIGASDYASITLLSDSTWCEAICNSDYISNIINTSVPTMTSNTTPEGQCFSKTYDGSNNAYPWKAFDKNNSTNWLSAYSPSGEYIGYKFTTAKKIDVIKTRNITSPFSILSAKYQVSNDGTNYTDIQTLIGSSTDNATIFYNNIENKTPYLYHRLLITSVTSPSGRCGYTELDFYGRENGGVQTWLKAANIKKNYYALSQVLADTTTLTALMNNEDAVDYLVTVKNWISTITSNEAAMTAIGNSNYAANTLLSDHDWCNDICNSSYMESVLNTKVPVMVSNTNPYGEAFGDSLQSGLDYYYAFNGNESNTWVSAANIALPHYIGYTFTNEVSIHKITIKLAESGNGGFIKDFQIQGSNDSFINDIEPIYSGIAPNTTSSSVYVNYISNNNISRYSYRLLVSSTYRTNNAAGLYILQFYGRRDV